MKRLERRIKRIEEKLGMNERRRKMVVIIHKTDLNHAVPEPVEEWITYKRALAEAGQKPIVVFTADPAKELEARENLRKAAGDRK